MWEWCDKLKLGKPSAFIKRDIRSLPQIEAEFEADFFLDPRVSTEDEEAWAGVVIETEYGSVLAWEDVQLPPPTVNSLATLLAHAMLRPKYDEHQRPAVIYLRDRPQWQELLPHLRQLGIEVVLSEDLPWIDEAVIEWMRDMKKPPSADKIKMILRKSFPERQRTWFRDGMILIDWSHTMCKGAYPSQEILVPAYEPTTIVSVRLTAEEVEAILNKTIIATSRKLRLRLKTMAAEGKTIQLNINEWDSILLALCGLKVNNRSDRKYRVEIAKRLANRLAEALNIEPPDFSLK